MSHESGEDYDRRPPDMFTFDYAALADAAERILHSGIIEFKPDKWIENAELTRTIMLGGKSVLQADVGSRLIEVFRSFIFGNWLSVIALSRAALEYALFNNCRKKWGISPMDEKGDYISLQDLIREVSRHDQELGTLMDFIRKEGNKALHRKEKGGNWNKLEQLWRFNKRDEAKECIEKLIRAMEMIYLPPGTAKSGNRPLGS